MTHRPSELEPTDRDEPTSRFEVHGLAAGFYVALLKHGYFDEATEFAEWYLDTFDHDLES